MPDNVVFCPGCGRRNWVPGSEVWTTVNRPAARIMNPPAAPTSTGDTTSVRGVDNLLAASAYITCIPAIFFPLVEPFKRNRFVRFHSFQSIFLAVATILLAVVMRILYSIFVLIPVVGFLLAWLASAVLLLGWFILWLVLLVKSLQGEKFKLPWLGNLAEKI
jgi:uncharacterized membrane protein